MALDDIEVICTVLYSSAHRRLEGAMERRRSPLGTEVLSDEVILP